MPVSSALAAEHRRDPDGDGPGDAELIAEVRAGRTEAYGLLYRRHVESARSLARQLTRCPAEADDLVADAFSKLFSTLRRGGGPDSAFRAYLLTMLRNARHDRSRRDRRVQLSDDMTRHDPGVPWEDPAVAGLESRLAARAFSRLPERWQTVLWRTEIEQQTPAQLAPQLGLTPNGVSALAYRAREALRQAYLQEHLDRGLRDPDRGTDRHRAPVDPDGHRATVDQLGAWTRGGLSGQPRARVDTHLAGCPDCRALAAELADVDRILRRRPLQPAATGRQQPRRSA